MGVIYRKQFNELIYEGETSFTPAHGKLLWFLFRRLQRFNDPLEDAVVSLLSEGSYYLDVGCGEGDLCRKVKDRFHKRFGIDIAENRIRHAKEKNKGAHFFVADLDEKLPFKDGIFDTVTCIDTFQYCFDPYHGVREFFRILKKDGVLIIQVTNIAWLPYRLKLLAGGLFTTSLAQKYGWDGGVLHYFTFTTLEEFLKEEGFRVLKRTSSGVLSKWRKWWLSLLCSDIIIQAIKV